MTWFPGIILVAPWEDEAVRGIAARLVHSGHPPALILLASFPERLLTNLQNHRFPRRPAKCVAPSLESWGIPILPYERLDGGRTLLELLRRPEHLVLLAAAGGAGRAFRTVAGGRLLEAEPGQGGPAHLGERQAEALADAALAVLGGPPRAGDEPVERTGSAPQ